MECGGEEREDAAFGGRHGSRSTHPHDAPPWVGEPWILGAATGGAASAPGAWVIGPRPPARQPNFIPHSTTLPRGPYPGTEQAEWRGLSWPFAGPNSMRERRSPVGMGAHVYDPPLVSRIGVAANER